MTNAIARDLLDISARLPDGVRIREYAPEDLQRWVEFGNRFVRRPARVSIEDARHWESMWPANDPRVRLVVEDRRGAIVAQAVAQRGGLFPAPDGAAGIGVQVDPAWRRRGMADSLLDHLEGFLRGLGASRVIGNIREDEPEGLAFAEHRGYREFHRRYQSYLDVRRFDATGFPDPAELVARAGVRVASLDDVERERAADPDAFHRELHARSNEMFLDVPAPDLQPMPYEVFLKVFVGSPTLDHRASFLALREGRIVGMTLTDVNRSGVGYTFFTGVARAERGQRLALALKLRMVAALRQRAVELVGTTNDEANAPMRAINTKMGYETEPAAIKVELRF